jgi:hypothetical protein
MSARVRTLSGTGGVEAARSSHFFLPPFPLPPLPCFRNELAFRISGCAEKQTNVVWPGILQKAQ